MFSTLLSIAKDIRRPWSPENSAFSAANTGPRFSAGETQTIENTPYDKLVSLTSSLSNLIAEIGAGHSRLLKRTVPLSAKLLAVSRCLRAEMAVISEPDMQKLSGDLLQELLWIVTVGFAPPAPRQAR